MNIKRVFKYAFAIITDDFVIPMPEGAQILMVQMQGENPCIWSLVDATKPESIRKFRVAGTGHQISMDENSEYIYINTFQMLEGALVFHLFERIEK